MVLLFRDGEGGTRLIVPDCNDRELVRDTLEEGIRALDEGAPIVRH